MTAKASARNPRRRTINGAVFVLTRRGRWRRIQSAGGQTFMWLPKRGWRLLTGKPSRADRPLLPSEQYAALHKTEERIMEAMTAEVTGEPVKRSKARRRAAQPAPRSPARPRNYDALKAAPPEVNT